MGSHYSTSSFINNTNVLDKVDIIISTLEDIINTFRVQGCPEGKELLRKILSRNRLLGGSPLEAVSGVNDSYDKKNKASS